MDWPGTEGVTPVSAADCRKPPNILLGRFSHLLVHNSLILHAETDVPEDFQSPGVSSCSPRKGPCTWGIALLSFPFGVACIVALSNIKPSTSVRMSYAERQLETDAAQIPLPFY